LVDLVYRHHQGYAGSLGVLYRFLGLRHHAVIGGHHQDHNVGGLGTAGTHRSKGRVTGGIEEGDHAAVGFHVVGTDVLGNATGFAGGHAGTADVVEQRGLAMVNVTHDGNHAVVGDFLALVLHVLGETVFQIAFLDLLDLVTHVFSDSGRVVQIQNLVDGHHGAVIEFVLDHLGRLDRHLLV